MSFSSEVKKELLAVEAKSRHCQLAELSAMLSGSGEVSVQNGQVQVSFVTENQQAVARYTKLLGQAGGYAGGQHIPRGFAGRGGSKKAAPAAKADGQQWNVKNDGVYRRAAAAKKLLQAGVPSGRVFGGGINQQSEKIVPF